ncbi:MAG: hydroxymethylbilane synthase [Filomicrobium sp.]
MQETPIKIGTRGSPLALAQAHEVRSRLMAAHGLDESRFEIVVIKTSGDTILDRPLSEVGGKGLFTKEIEEALIAGTIDLAVHSMKDVATELPPGLSISTILPREDVRDAFISLHYASLSEMPEGAKVGTSSLRRAAQVKYLRPDLEVVGFRGNVQTRLQKLQDGVADATFLACAGLNRLGIADRITSAVETGEMLPAVAQGAVGIEVREEDEATKDLLAALNDEVTALCVTAERAFLRTLEGSCRTPIGGIAELSGGQLTLRGEVLSPDGKERYHGETQGPAATAIKMGEGLAQELLNNAGEDFVRRLKAAG